MKQPEKNCEKGQDHISAGMNEPLEVLLNFRISMMSYCEDDSGSSSEPLKISFMLFRAQGTDQVFSKAIHQDTRLRIFGCCCNLKGYWPESISHPFFKTHCLSVLDGLLHCLYSVKLNVSTVFHQGHASSLRHI